jgi:serine/threonine-protein kinase
MGSSADLVAAIRALNLLDPPQVQEAVRLQAAMPDARVLAKELIRRGWLTPFQVNQLFQGKGPSLVMGFYVLLEKLGEGGMGEVYKAYQRTRQRYVALKFIRKERLKKRRALKRFSREIRAAARVSHPNIVSAYEAGTVGQSHFLVMEYVHGIDLAKLVSQRGPLAVEQACDYIRQAALGLQHVHEQGLVHRDIKPSNLVVTTKASAVPVGTIKILDLGLARLNHLEADAESSSTLTQEGAVLGTPDYAAPEQTMAAHTVDIRADLYSLGCMFYYLLTGRPPFPGGTLGEKLVKHQLAEPVAVESLRPGVPAGVTAIIRKLMAKQPADRFQTPAELAVVLGEVLRGSKAASPRITAVQPGAPLAIPVGRTAATPPTAAWVTPPSNPPLEPGAPGRRRFWLALAAVLGLLVLLTVTVVKPLVSPTQPEPFDESIPPLDRFHPGRIPRQELQDGQPRELVAVIGEHAEGAARKYLLGSFAPDGRTLALIKGNTIILWDLATMQERLALTGHTDPVNAAAFAPSGTTLASGSSDKSVRIWDVVTGQELARLEGHLNWVTSVAYSPNGQTLASADWDGTVRLWDVPLRTQLVSKPPKTFQGNWVAFAPDEKSLATGNRSGAVQIWDISSGAKRTTFTPHTAWCVCTYSPDGKVLATAGYDGRAVLWHASTTDHIKEWRLRGGFSLRVAYAADGKHLAIGNTNGTVYILRLPEELRKAGQ